MSDEMLTRSGYYGKAALQRGLVAERFKQFRTDIQALFNVFCPAFDGKLHTMAEVDYPLTAPLRVLKQWTLCQSGASAFQTGALPVNE